MRSLFVVGLILFAFPALAGEQADAGQKLDDKLMALDAQIQMLEGNVSELDARVQALEAGEPPLPPDPEGPVEGVEPGQEPFAQHKLPIRIQAEAYDTGGEGVAYHDTAVGNNGGKYRTDDVDVKDSADNGAGYQVGWIKPGEWLEYTIGGKAFNYDILLRVSSGHATPGIITVTVDGSEVGVVNVPNTGGYDSGYVTRKILNVPVRDGDQILRLDFSGNNLDLNWIEFIPSGSTLNHPPCDIIFGVPEGFVVDQTNCDEPLQPAG